MYFEPSIPNTFHFEPHLKKLDAEDDYTRDTREICRMHLKGECLKGHNCPDKHLRPDKAIVCEYWLRGICKKADQCEFMHEFDIRRMPECFYYAIRGECLNPECVFVHVNPDDEIKECPYYKRGFCSMGPRCRYKHIARVLCPNYMAGFCLDGRMCKYAHPKFNHPLEDELADEPLWYIPLSQRRPRKEFEDEPGQPATQKRRLDEGPTRSLSEVTCFKCGEKGHYANQCPNDKNWAIQGRIREETFGRSSTAVPTSTSATDGPPAGAAPQDSQQRFQQNYIRNITCYYCGVLGHRIAECPSRPGPRH
eukprot:RCo013378